MIQLQMRCLLAASLMLAAQVEVSHGKDGGGTTFKRSYKARGLTNKAADTAEFQNEAEGTTMTVAQYFQQNYNIRSAAGNCPHPANATSKQICRALSCKSLHLQASSSLALHTGSLMCTGCFPWSTCQQLLTCTHLSSMQQYFTADSCKEHCWA